MKRKYLFIEGTRDTSNGNLREGFHKLLVKKLAGVMPTISMGDGKEQTVKKFINSENSKLLCDLDGPESEVASDLNENGIASFKENVFYMIQEMEAWFISQPGILDNFYGEKVSGKLARKPANEFPEPDNELMKITVNSRRKQYHKVNHGAQLLAMLDADQLCKDFPDFKRLIERLTQ